MTTAAPTLETILCSPQYLGLTSATPVQRAKCRIVQGLPLGDLACDPHVREMVGGDVAILPASPPAESVDISAIRVAKTLGGAAHALHASQSIDASPARPGDIIRYFVAALKLDGTRPFMSHMLAGIARSPAIASIVVGEPTMNSVRLRHPSGAIIEVTPVPIDRAGASALSVFCAGAFVDEGPRMIGEEDGVKNYDHFRNGVLGRLLPGAQFVTAGSPWQPYGPIYDQFLERFGKPGKDLVILRTRGAVANPSWWTTERMAELRARNPIAYRTDCLAEFADGEAAVMPSAAVEACFARRPERAYQACEPIIVADPSQLRHDTWAAMIVGMMLPVTDEQEGLLWVDPRDPRVHSSRGPRGACIQFRPEFDRQMALLFDEQGQPMRNPDFRPPKSVLKVHEIVGWDGGAKIAADELVRQVMLLGRKYGCRDVHSDQGEQYALEAHFRACGGRFRSWPWTTGPLKTVCMDRLRSLIVEQRLALPKHDRLRGELLRVRARATAGGFAYVVPGQGHGDFLACLLVAMRVDLEGILSGSPMKRDLRRHETR